MTVETKERPKGEQTEEILLDIEDPESARETISKAIEEGKLPVISVPEKYVEAAKKGIVPHATWIGEQIIAGTILREPYSPEGEKRHFFKISLEASQIEPRFTGPDKHFHGVVAFHGPIPPEAIQEITF